MADTARGVGCDAIVWQKPDYLHSWVCDRPAKYKRGSWDVCGIHARPLSIEVRASYYMRVTVTEPARRVS